MAHVLQALKSVGDNITRAELVTFLDNLEWFWRPPCYRLYSTAGNSETVETTIGTMDYAASSTPHYEWLIQGGDGSLALGTYHTGTGGLWVNVGDVDGGVWLNGVMFAAQNVATAVGGQDPRSMRVLLRRGDGTTWTELADYVAEDRNTGRRGSVHLAGLGVFNGSTDRVEVRAQVSTGSQAVVADRRWGVRLGDDGVYADDYAAARQVSDTNDELRQAYNRLRSNQYRIERRPSAQRRKSGSNQALTADVEALVTMGDEDWSTPASMAPAASFPNLIIAPADGVYLITGQMTLDGYNSGASIATATLKRNASTNLVNANAPEANNYDTVVPVVDLVEMSDGDYISLYGTTGTASSVQASRGTTITATLMSSNSGVSTGRQVWDRMPHPDTWPAISSKSSERLTAADLRIISDLTDRQWHRPAVKVSLADDAEVKMGAGWTNIDMDTIGFDYTDLEDTHGYSLLSGGALRLPWAGIWLVGARLQFSAQSVDGANIGDQGTRGMRLVLGERQSVGAFIGAAMNVSTHGWTRTLMETVVVNRDDGQDVRLQGLAAPSIGGVAELTSGLGTLADSGGSDNAADIVELADAIATLSTMADASDYEIPVTSAQLWAVELGEGVTRDPR